MAEAETTDEQVAKEVAAALERLEAQRRRDPKRRAFVLEHAPQFAIEAFKFAYELTGTERLAVGERNSARRDRADRNAVRLAEWGVRLAGAIWDQAPGETVAKTEFKGR